MITLEISPHIIQDPLEPMFSMESEFDEETATENIRVFRSPDGKLIATGVQSANPMHQIRFFQGKGGLCTIVIGHELIYFGLPGSRILLNDTDVNMPGEPITGKPADFIRPPDQAPFQQVTRQAMILGAGLATRFEPISGDLTGYPKPGVPLAGEDSVIAVIAKHLKRHGFTRIIVNTFYKPESLHRQLKAIDGLEVVFLEESSPSGTAGGLAQALTQGLVDQTQPVFIVQGDAVTDAHFSLLMNTHMQRNAAVTIGGQIVPDRDVDKFGIVQTDGAGGDGQSGNIASFQEKPSLAEAGSARFANAGFYVLAPEVYPLFLSRWKGQLHAPGLYDYAKDFFPAVLEAVANGKVIRNGQPMTFWAQAVGGYWSDIGNPAQYVEALHDVYQGKLQIDLPENRTAFYDQGVVYWPGTHEPAQRLGAQLEGNVIVARRFV